jgi:Zn-dependent peptidase ImmA (M78 family)
MDDGSAGLMLGTVRVARGLTQSALAKDAGVSQATVSKVESGVMSLPDAQWDRLAEILDAPSGLLSQPVGFAGAPATAFHRKRASLSVSVANQLRARLDLVHLQLSGLVGDRVPVEIRRDPLDDDGYTSPEEVAQRVRSALRIAQGPIADLIAVIEGAGVVVVNEDLGSVKVDALMSWPPGGRPVVLLGEHAPGDRQRFSLAHELGHAVMHEVPTAAQESEADRFAAELLMPRADIAGSLSDVSMAALARLKRVWGVSMAALLRRARDLDQISDYQYRQGSIELSRAGYRTREPVEVAAGRPRLLGDCLAAQMAVGVTVQALAGAAWMTEPSFRSTYLEGES